MTTIESSDGAAIPGAPAHPARASRLERPLSPPRLPPPPPRRYVVPRQDVPREPLTPWQLFIRGVLAMIVALLIMFILDLVVFGPIQHLAAQQQLRDTYAAQLAEGTAPVSEGDYNGVLLGDGAPVGILTIPRIGVSEVLVEGTSSADLRLGPGHRRDTVLPGQVGVSVIMGRAAGFGGPFGSLQALQPGDQFQVRTGQGLNTFEVIGLRYAGDPSPPSLAKGESRVILMTARGLPFVPVGVAYVDARLVGDGQAAGLRQTTPLTLPAADTVMATDTSTVWALVFALQFLIAAEIAAVWAWRRVGRRKAWIALVPVLLLANLFVADQLVRLLPNLL